MTAGWCAVAALLGALAVTACGVDEESLRAGSGPTSKGEPAETGLAARLCAEAAQAYDGQVAAAHDTTVQAVREHMADPHGTNGDSSIGPVPGAYTYPEGWATKAPDDPAAACYLDAAIPIPRPPGAPAADRALVMAAEGAESFLASAGPRESMGSAPLAATGDGAAPTPTNPGASGTASSLTCGTNSRSVGLNVDYAADAVGQASASAAAHVLLDEKGFARELYSEREGRSPTGGAVLEYRTAEGDLVAYVTVELWSDGRWLATGLVSCDTAFPTDE